MQKPSVILAIVLLTLASFAPMAAAQDMNGISLHKAAARDDAATIKALRAGFPARYRRRCSPQRHRGHREESLNAGRREPRHLGGPS